MAKEVKGNQDTNTPEEVKGNQSVNLADVEAQVKTILDNAKAEAAKIVADAKASVSGGLTEEQKKAAEEQKAYYNEEVEIELFKDSGKYKDDVFVAVNGVGYLIQRGKKIKVKRKVALAIENSLKQDKKTSDLIDLKVRELQDAESKL